MRFLYTFDLFEFITVFFRLSIKLSISLFKVEATDLDVRSGLDLSFDFVYSPLDFRIIKRKSFDKLF